MKEIFFKYEKFIQRDQNILIISCYHDNFSCESSYGDASRRINSEQAKLSKGHMFSAKFAAHELEERFVKGLEEIQKKYLNINKVLFTGDINLGFTGQKVIAKFLFDSTIQKIFPNASVSRILKSANKDIIEYGIKYAEEFPLLDDVLLQQKGSAFKKIVGNFSFTNEFNREGISPKPSPEDPKSSFELKIKEEKEDQIFKKMEIELIKKQVKDLQNHMTPLLITVKNVLRNNPSGDDLAKIASNPMKTMV